MNLRILAGLFLSFTFDLAIPIRSQAAVVRASPDSFLVLEEATTSVSASKAVSGFGEIGKWWNGDHTYSGKPASLQLTLSAGGCFCEIWTNGSVEHARVLMVINGKIVRLKGALGPLQGMAVDAVLDFSTAAETENGITKLKLSYLVNGAAASELDKIAPSVDSVMNDALQRLVQYLGTAKADN